MTMPGPQMPMPGPDCDYCAKPAQIVEQDGKWCGPECQRFDRQSEIRFWRQSFAPQTRWSVTPNGVEAQR